jgi:outer membrane receptor protein involved in Fe transport
MFAVLVVFTFSASFVFGQGITTGSISGTIEDPQHAVVSGASITATQKETNTQAKGQTNSSGYFAMRNLPVGTYTVVIEAPTFSKLQISPVSVNSGTETSMGIRTMRVGAQETVTVEATTPLIESNSSQISATYGSQQLTDLPISNTFDNIALLTPGVASTHDNSFSNNNQQNGDNLSVNGQRGRSNNFEIDGQNNNDNSVGGSAFFFGNQDALQEVQVVTNNFSAEYGRNMGSVVNYVTKAGTNSFHGTGYEFWQGSTFSSFKNEQKSEVFGFCNPQQNAAVDGCTAPVLPRVVDNRWGGTLGGPIVKNKLWFFGSTNYERNRQGVSPASSGNSLAPTLNGIASLAAAFPGNPAVASLQAFSPFAVKNGNPTASNIQNILVNGIPVEFAAVDRLVPAAADDKEITGRVDWQATNKDHVFGRYLFQRQLFTGNLANGATAIAQGGFIDVSALNQAVGIDWARSWTDHLVNQVRVSYFRENVGFEGGADPGCLRTSITSCPSFVSFPGTNAFSYGYANNLPQGRLVNNTQFQDNTSWQKGKHTIKFGGEYDRQRSPNTFLPNVNGTYQFRKTNAASTGTTAIGEAYANFLSGAGRLNLADGLPSINYKEQDAAAYVQDDWRVRDNLTLNLGIRWEFTQQAVNLLHDITTSREANAATAFWDPTLPLADRTVQSVPQVYHNWGPNVGFAWTPGFLSQANKTVIRGGYRIAYDPSFYNIFLNIQTSAPTVNAGTVFCDGVTVVCLSPNGTSGVDTRAAGLPFLPRGGDPRARNETNVTPNFHNPYTENYSLGIQHEFSPKIVAEVRYAGNHTVGNFQTLDGNPFVGNTGNGSGLAGAFPQFIPPGVTFCSDPTQPGDGAPDCTHGNIRTRANTAFSIYNGLQTRLDFRNYHGITAGVSYTWSRAIDNVSEIFSTGAGGNTVASSADPFNANQLERGVSGISYPNVTSVYINYEVPWMRSQHGIMGKLLGGWSIDPVYEFNSGEPTSVGQGVGDGSLCDGNFNASFIGFDSCRPFLSNPNAPLQSAGIFTGPGALVDFNGNPTTPAQVHWILNEANAASAFGFPFGTGRNTVRGQTWNNLDLTMLKDFKLTERFTFRLQATALNVMNRQYRGTYDPFIDDFVANSSTGLADPLHSSFMNNHFNQLNGEATNQRLLILGGKIIF